MTAYKKDHPRLHYPVSPTEGVGDWEKEFDRFYRLPENMTPGPQRERAIKHFIHSLLRSQTEEMRHDHEILVNTTLDTKRKEAEEIERKIKEMRPKGISIIEKEGSEFTTPRMYRALGYAKAIDDIIKMVRGE